MPATMLLSGPAGGLMGARTLAGQAGRSRIMTFDMGGTSTDVALIDGEILGPGRHESAWGGRDSRGRAVAAGVYFYHLDAGGHFQKTRRMVLVK